MLDLIASFPSRALRLIGRHFLAVRMGGALVRATWLALKMVIGAMLLTVIGLYGFFFWNTQRWAKFNPDYVAAYHLPAIGGLTGHPALPEASIIGTSEATGTGEGATCRRSVIVDMTADLIDFNVNQNEWISSMILYKL
jgi:hypothetical protein